MIARRARVAARDLTCGRCATSSEDESALCSSLWRWMQARQLGSWKMSWDAAQRTREAMRLRMMYDRFAPPSRVAAPPRRSRERGHGTRTRRESLRRPQILGRPNPLLHSAVSREAVPCEADTVVKNRGARAGARIRNSRVARVRCGRPVCVYLCVRARV